MKRTSWGIRVFRSIYLPKKMAMEVKAEAARLERSTSYVIRRAWKIARKRILAWPSEDDFVKELE